jgi:AmmeMemoRadiSam system protein A
VSVATLTPADERALLDAALDAIERVLVTGSAAEPDLRGVADVLAEPGATFVTLTRLGALLGCIGTLRAHRPLVVDVAGHAVAAAFADPRLPAITPDDYRAMDLKVSVLGPLEPLAVRDPAELGAAITPGRDGLLVEARRGRATFLPSVWEQLPDLDGFLAALWRKAGWRPGAWPADLRAWRYRTREFGDAPPRSLPRVAAAVHR